MPRKPVRYPAKKGRRPIPVSEEKMKLIKDLAALQMPVTSISSLTGLSTQTLVRRFGGIIREGRENSKAVIAQTLFKMATQGANPDKKVAMYLGDRLLYRRQHEEDEIDTSTETDAQAEAAKKPNEYVLNWADENPQQHGGKDGAADPEAEE